MAKHINSLENDKRQFNNSRYNLQNVSFNT